MVRLAEFAIAIAFAAFVLFGVVEVALQLHDAISKGCV